MDSLSIGDTPTEEQCVSVRPNHDYHAAQKAECKAYIVALRRHLGNEPEGAELYVKSNSHDFGSYYSVECRFDGNNEAATMYAYACEDGSLETWEQVGIKATITVHDGWTDFEAVDIKTGEVIVATKPRRGIKYG